MQELTNACIMVKEFYSEKLYQIQKIRSFLGDINVMLNTRNNRTLSFKRCGLVDKLTYLTRNVEKILIIIGKYKQT